VNQNGQGLAKQLLKASMDSLYQMSYDEIDLYVTLPTQELSKFMRHSASSAIGSI
jgi:hypothetical protein